MRSPKSLRVTLPMVLAALVLSVAGSLSTASATTYWRYQNSWEGNCLTASPTTANVWTTTCDESSANQNWWWGESYTDPRGYTFRRLISRVNGHCLTTDAKSQNNAVWTSPCGNAPDQWWNADNNWLWNLNAKYLRSSGNGDAVYTTEPYLDGVEVPRYEWWGFHN